MVFNENGIPAFVRTLLEHRMNRKKLLLAEDIVFTILVAVICGAHTREEIVEFGHSK